MLSLKFCKLCLAPEHSVGKARGEWACHPHVNVSELGGDVVMKLDISTVMMLLDMIHSVYLAYVLSILLIKKKKGGDDKYILAIEFFGVICDELG